MSLKTDILKIKQLQQRFARSNSISVDELHNFYGSLSQSTIYLRIRKLLSTGVLQKVGWGLYKLGNETVYYPDLSGSDKSIYNRVRKKFPYAKVCVWKTDCLNEFTRHQMGKYSLLIEAEKDAAESIFNFSREHYKNVFLNPTKEIYHKYVSGQKRSIVILNLISEAPLQEVEGICVPSIEKILVDLFANKIIFSAWQGNEMRYIFSEAIGKYTVNWNALFRYAGRRSKKQELEQYIKSLIFRQ